MDSNLKKPLLGSQKKGSPAAALPPVDVKMETYLLMMDIKKLIRVPPFPDILFVFVNLWALISACTFGSFSAYNLFGPIGCDQRSVSKTCYVLTDAAGKEASAMVYGTLWCSVIQAAAAVAGLLLTLTAGSRRRRALTYAALAATTAVHCMFGRVLYLFVATYPRDGLAIAAILAILIALYFDLICFQILNLVENGEEIGQQSKRD